MSAKNDEEERVMERSPRGRYIRFDVKLGTGAYKTVYKAYDTDQGIDVAWNAIDINLLPTTEKTRIIQEVQLLQKLEHKNIINFYGSWFSKEKNQVVFITEIMTSGTLKSYIKRVQFVKWKIIKRWCVQILEGLHYLHSQEPPVIHRDLKCDNIFINGNTGDLRIGDLGLSTQLAMQRSRAQSVLGTPEFMAPELYDENYDEKVDIYAFGMCVLEMVTKEVPYSECVNPAQIYKKVTAGIRPKGLQRIISQPAKDFIELCLSRGNGEIDVSAEYLLDHPFLKPQEEDDRMVQCLDEDVLEREVPSELDELQGRDLSTELNMESCSKSNSIVSDKRFGGGNDMEEIGSASNSRNSSLVVQSRTTSAPGSASGSGSGCGSGGASGNQSFGSGVVGAAMRNEAFMAEKKVAGKRMVLMGPNASGPPSDPAAIPPLPPKQQPPDVEPISETKESNVNTEQFLAGLPGGETNSYNKRMNLLGGRNHRVDAYESKEYSNEEVEGVEKDPHLPPTPRLTPSLSTSSSVDSTHDTSNSTSGTSGHQQHLSSSSFPAISRGARSGSTPNFEASHGGASTIKRAGSTPILEQQGNMDHRRPLVSPIQPNETGETTPSAIRLLTPTNAAVGTGGAMKKRGKRHEIKATKDLKTPHSILLNLRIMLDGKSKEIKFPFNLFTDSIHDVACELAVDVGILEPDLGDIADSIRFLVTEGKINNLPEVDEDVWEEAPEPHSFSVKPLPHVSKITFVTASRAPSSGGGGSGGGGGNGSGFVGDGGASLPTPTALNPLDLERATTLPSFSLNEPNATTPMLISSASTSSLRAMSKEAPAAMMNDAASMRDAFGISDVRNRSPLRRGTIATIGEAAAVIAATSAPSGASTSGSSPEELGVMDSSDRGGSGASASGNGGGGDPTYLRKIRHYEDRLASARSAFEERESSLEAAIRSEEEKHQREVERFRRKMQEFHEKKQRAAMARQERMKQVVEEFRAEVDFAASSPSDASYLATGPVGGNGLDGSTSRSRTGSPVQSLQHSGSSPPAYPAGHFVLTAVTTRASQPQETHDMMNSFGQQQQPGTVPDTVEDVEKRATT